MTKEDILKFILMFLKFLRDYKFFDGVKGGKMIFNSAFDDKVHRN